MNLPGKIMLKENSEAEKNFLFYENEPNIDLIDGIDLEDLLRDDSSKSSVAEFQQRSTFPALSTNLYVQIFVL